MFKAIGKGCCEVKIKKIVIQGSGENEGESGFRGLGIFEFQLKAKNAQKGIAEDKEMVYKGYEGKTSLRRR